MSDHGFAAFDHAVNLNTWLQREGFYKVGRKASTGLERGRTRWDSTRFT